MVVVVLAAVLVELVARGGLLLLRRTAGLDYRPVPFAVLTEPQRTLLQDMLDGRHRYLGHSGPLGWTIKPGGAAADGGYRANQRGLRADREYQEAPPAGVVRVAAFGDSFTHGDGVPNAAAWPARLGGLGARLEVLNFGVPGYGLDQALLRYRLEGRAYRPGLVLIGFMTENIHRHVNVFRPFYLRDTHLPLAKPRFVLDGGGLTLVPNPLPSLDEYRRLLEDDRGLWRRLARGDGHYQAGYTAGPLDGLGAVRLAKMAVAAGRAQLGGHPPILTRDGSYNPESEAFRITAALIESFYRESVEEGSVPVVLVLPDRPELERHRAARATTYRPLLARLADAGHRHLDLIGALGALPVKEALGAVHYSVQGNLAVALEVRSYLEQQGLLSVEGVARAHAEERRRLAGRPAARRGAISLTHPYRPGYR